jgi:hypothetical protein
MTSLRDYEAGRDAAAAKKLPLLCCGSSGRPSFAWAARRSFIGTVLLWTCLVLAGVVLAGLLSPLLSPGGYAPVCAEALTGTRSASSPDHCGTPRCRELPRLRLRVARAERDDAAAAELATPPTLAADTLVLYVFSNTDPESERNLGFFVRHGMAEGDGCDYVVIVQQARPRRTGRRACKAPWHAALADRRCRGTGQ